MQTDRAWPIFFSPGGRFLSVLAARSFFSWGVETALLHQTFSLGLRLKKERRGQFETELKNAKTECSEIGIQKELVV